jgi:LacI family sucrose operon transcriptional repressor
MTTLKDVADKAGVSITTVSRVLNHQGSISQKTKDKIFRTIKELNYIPNEMARSLSNRNSHLIGLIVPYIKHPFFSTLTDAIGEACYQAGYKLILCASGSHPDREQEIFSMLRANNVAGVLICSRIDDVSIYSDTDLPLISIERTIDNIPSVSCDNYKGGQLAAQELIRSGCKYLVLFGNHTAANDLPAYQRYQGFCDACMREKADYYEFYIGAEDLYGEKLHSNLECLFKKYPKADGIFATSDVLAAKVINNLEGIKKKQKTLKIIGFDGIDISEYCNISTIAQPIGHMGILAVDILIKTINGLLVPERSILPVKLIRRASSGVI